MPVTFATSPSSGSTTLRTLNGPWIRERAKAVGFKRLEDLAGSAGITRQQLHRLLAGQFLPSAPTEHGLAASLRCMIEDLYQKRSDQGSGQ